MIPLIEPHPEVAQTILEEYQILLSAKGDGYIGASTLDEAIIKREGFFFARISICRKAVQCDKLLETAKFDGEEDVFIFRNKV